MKGKVLVKRDSEYVGSNIPWKEREKIRHEMGEVWKNLESY